MNTGNIKNFKNTVFSSGATILNSIHKIHSIHRGEFIDARLDNEISADYIMNRCWEKTTMTDEVLKSPYPQRELTEEEKRELFAKRMEGAGSFVVQCSDCKFFSIVDNEMKCEKKVISRDILHNKIVCKYKEQKIKR